MNKKVSVIMGLYNCELTLCESLDSILNQTYTNWEIIMCDDGSQDNTYIIASRYMKMYPNKIILLKNEKNMGLNFTLNKCLKYVKGQYIARMDADDISISNRFEIQVRQLEEREDISFISSPMIFFDEKSEWGVGKAVEFPQKEDFVKGTPFCHAPMMIRKEVMNEVGGYSESKFLLRVEDYHLWFKIYEKGYRGYNIQIPLYKMRDDQNAINRRKFKYRINEAYVKYIGFKMLNIEWPYYFYILKPIIVGLIPTSIYKHLHRRRLQGEVKIEV